MDVNCVKFAWSVQVLDSSVGDNGRQNRGNAVIMESEWTTGVLDLQPLGKSFESRGN